jgi:hypothetical protein
MRNFVLHGGTGPRMARQNIFRPPPGFIATIRATSSRLDQNRGRNAVLFPKKYQQTGNGSLVDCTARGQSNPADLLATPVCPPRNSRLRNDNVGDAPRVGMCGVSLCGRALLDHGPGLELLDGPFQSTLDVRPQPEPVICVVIAVKSAERAN